MLPKYLELSGFLSKKSEPTGQFWNVTKGRTNLTHLKSDVLLVWPYRKQESVSITLFFCLTTIEIWYDYIFWLIICPADIVDLCCCIPEFLSDLLEVPSCGINIDTLQLIYASLLWNYGISKARNGYLVTMKNQRCLDLNKLRLIKMLCSQPLIK